MTTHERQSDLPRSSGDLSVPALIRAAADGELTAPERAAFERVRAADPSIDARVEFERALRERVAGAMREPAAAPASLRDSITGMFEREREIDRELGVETLAVQTRSRRFWASGPTWLAVAASLALLTAVTVLMQTPVGSTVAPMFGNAAAARLMNASDFIVAEHDKCSAFDQYFERKFDVRDSAQAPDAVVELLGQPPIRINLDEAGYEFTGVGGCHVPGPGASAHLIYKSSDGSRPTLSLFIQKDTGASPRLETGVRYRCRTTAGAPVLVWRDAGVIYYLFSPDDEARDSATRLFNAPTVERTL